MSSIEPSLQPSFTFPSRHNTANYGKGLLDQSAASQLLLVRPARNTNIDMATSMQSTLTTPKTLDKDVIDVKAVLPVETAIYVQPGLAEGMTGLAKQTNADVEITKITSGNNALKRGNYIAAEHLIGRRLTQEEIANKTQTPNTRTSEMDPSHQTHVEFSNAAFGSQVAPGLKNFQERQNDIKKADRNIINHLAAHYGLAPDVVSHVKTSLGFTGDSILGSRSQYSPAELESINQQFLHNFTEIYGVDPWQFKNRGAVPNAPGDVPNIHGRAQPVSNIPGENRQSHSGRKADNEKRNYKRDHPHFVVGPNGYTTYRPDPEFFGARMSVEDELHDTRAGGPPDFNNGPRVLNPQSVYHVQTNVPAEEWESDEEEEKFQPPANPDALNKAEMKEAVYVREGGLQAQFLREVDRVSPALEYQQGSNDLKQAHADIKEEEMSPIQLTGRRRKFEMEGAAIEQLNKVRAGEPAGRKRRANGDYYYNTYFEEWDNNKRIKGEGIRPRRSMKRQHFQVPSQNFIPQTDSFSDRGALVSGKLMQNTGRDAVPLSAQIQVANTHQLYETPLRDWVKHPNYTSEVRPDPIPISQNLEGVGKRTRKVKLGGYMVDHHKLLSQNVLSISHPTGRKVKGMPNREVSDGLKEAIHNIITGGKVNTKKLKAEEKLHLRDLLHNSAANVSLGADVNVSPSQQLHLILGEMEAGNDSAELKTQLRKLLPSLKRSKSISAEVAADISKHYL